MFRGRVPQLSQAAGPFALRCLTWVFPNHTPDRSKGGTEDMLGGTDMQPVASNACATPGSTTFFRGSYNEATPRNVPKWSRGTTTQTLWWEHLRMFKNRGTPKLVFL